MIRKHATELHNCKYITRYYNKGRAGMYDFLQSIYAQLQSEHILLPSYIGYSPKEGSGVYDPVEKVQGLSFSFYHVDLMLKIDMDSVRIAVENLNGKPFVFLRMDYYGFTDIDAERIHAFVRRNNGYVLEDNAHSVPSIATLWGQHSDACFYSTHKILPISAGGILMLRNPDLFGLELNGDCIPRPTQNLWEYDFAEIGAIRRQNFLLLEEYSVQYRDHFTPMRSLKDDTGTVPYSFPVILKHENRFALYNYFNERGFGVTCLYYAIISQIPIVIYPESKYLAEHILNFPVHQDVSPQNYVEMLNAMVAFYKEGN